MVTLQHHKANQPQDPTQQQQPYHDPPSPTHQSSIKPLPALPPYTDEPYTDAPPTPTSTEQVPRGDSYNVRPHEEQPYTDALLPSDHDTDNDDIPLAHFLPPHPYPHEAPPSYSVAVRSTHSYHDTLIQYIPSHRQHQTSQRWQTSNASQVVVEIDSESGEVLSRTDDVRHSVEKVVAMFVVAAVLLVISGVLVWLVLGSVW